MPSYLLITVGGSHEPIVRSLAQNRATQIVFLCSEDGPGTVGSRSQVEGFGNVLKSRPDLPGPDLPNIPTLARLGPDSWRVVGLVDPDDLASCYLTMAAELASLRNRDAEARFTADYTGGTKSMSAALVAAALDDGECELRLVSGPRRDLIKVQRGAETAAPVRVDRVQVHRGLEPVRALLTRFDYAGATRYLEDLTMRFSGVDTRPDLLRWLNLARAFDAWDRFDHAGAGALLELHAREFQDHIKAVKKLEKGAGATPEAVTDLLNNGARRACQQRYDDAVGRLYRALELTAQLWLRFRYALETGDLDLGKVPEEQRLRLQERTPGGGPVKIGLNEAWDLLAAFPGDPLGALFAARRGQVRNLLQVRNHSILAHGTRSVSEQDYRDLDSILGGLVLESLHSASAAARWRTPNVPQLPEKFD